MAVSSSDSGSGSAAVLAVRPAFDSGGIVRQAYVAGSHVQVVGTSPEELHMAFQETLGQVETLVDRIADMAAENNSRGMEVVGTEEEEEELVAVGSAGSIDLGAVAGFAVVEVGVGKKLVGPVALVELKRGLVGVHSVWIW